MFGHRFAFLVIPFMAIVGLPAVAQEAGEVRTSGSGAECACPKEGNWNAQNLEGWMNCTGPMNIKRTLEEVKDEGTIWILDEDCESIFSEASRKKDEDILMERGEDCTFKGVVNGEEDGMKMVIDFIWTTADEEIIKGEMHSNPSLQGMMCEYWRPYEITFDEALSEDEYPKRRKKMYEKLEKIRNEN